jgi:hypothetical protein
MRVYINNTVIYFYAGEWHLSSNCTTLLPRFPCACPVRAYL